MTADPWTWDAVRAAAADGKHPGVDDTLEAAPYRWKAIELQAAAEAAPFSFDVQTVAEFIAVNEPGASAIVGDADEALIPENGDAMFYGDGGAGKTTLAIDLACHLAAGDDWLGVTISRPVRVLLVENEGPRPLFRAKLRRKVDGWPGSELGGRLMVIEAPWARLSFADPVGADALATVIYDHAIDVVIVGPVTRLGMNDAGTLQEVRDFMALVGDVRLMANRPVTFALIHHENKGGKVSGAWEGAGDTLFHVSGQGHGRTRLYVQKARWASPYHATTLNLAWTDGEGFALEDKPEVTDETLAEQIIAAVRASPGTGWTRVEEETKGVGKQRRRQVRDGLLTSGQIVNIGAGDEWLDHCPERKSARLYLASDPTIQHLRPDWGADGAQSAPPSGVGIDQRLRPAPRLKGGAGAGADPPPADLLGEAER